MKSRKKYLTERKGWNYLICHAQRRPCIKFVSMPFLRSSRASISTALTPLSPLTLHGGLYFALAVKTEPLIAKFLFPVRPGRQKPRNMRVKRPVSFSTDDLRLFHMRFSRRKLCALVLPPFLIYAFTKPPPGFFPGGGCVEVLIAMRLEGFDSVYPCRAGQRSARSEF